MNITRSLFYILFFILGLAGSGWAASPLDQERTIEVSFSFTPPDELKDRLTGYTLFKGTSEICTVSNSEVVTSDPTASVFSCTFLTEDATFDFTLSAAYNDGSSSPLSPPFPYAIGAVVPDPEPEPEPEPEPPTETTGNKTITYTWQPSTTTDVTGYNMYMNETKLCSTSSPGDATLSCSADLINSVMEFSVTSTNSAGEESNKSNILTLNPLDFPDLFAKKKLTFDINYTDAVSSAGGYRVYNNDEPLCETTDSSASQIICADDLLSTTNVFAIRAIDASGTETDISNTITYTQTTDTTTPPDTTEPLVASLTTNVTSGEVPLTVSFDASGSTGDIASYSWAFGDGSVGSGALATHIFTISGTYTTTLTVTDADGATELKTVSIVALQSTLPPEPPTAIISSSTAAGNAPLDVTLDASGSFGPNPPITSYLWTFGDGSDGSGEVTTHTYSTAGTYYAAVTITDSEGLTDTVNTPILVTGVAPENQAPIASMIASPTTGSCPITVYLDGTASSDSDGSIASYSWNFGDGTTASGSTAQHTYTNPASHSISLQVTDNVGATTTTTKEISCTETVPENTLVVEIGELSITHEWVYVAFEKTFDSPVVIAGPPTVNETEPVVVRTRNITEEGFEIRLQEWDYLNGEHAEELVSYIVIEQGQTTLEDGSKIEAGYIPGNIAKATTTFQQVFTTTPVVLTTLSTDNDSSAVTGRVKNVSMESFEYTLKEEEAADQVHQTETVAYIAWQIGMGTEGGLIYESGVTKDSVRHKWATLSIQNEFTSLPFFFAMLQTLDGGDTTALRQQNLSLTGVEVKAEEEQSSDSETKHTSEVVGYLIIGSETVDTTPPDETPATGKKITLTWDFTGDETAITGFKFYNNGELVCEEPSPSSRSTTCDTALLESGNSFTITAVETTGAETATSNAITYQP